MILPYFGEIDLNNLEEYYEVIMSLESQKDFPLELWFDSEKLSSDDIEPTINILNTLAEEIKNSNKYLFQNGRKTIDKYLNHQLSELLKPEKVNFGILSSDNNQKALQKLEDKIHLKSISIWPENDAIIFDYTIGYLITDYVICIATNYDLNNWSIDIQS